MSQVIERPVTRAPTEKPVVVSQRSRGGTAMRGLGALALLVMGGVHLEQYFGVHFDVVPVIGPLFLLNFAGATAVAIGLLLPQLRRLHGLLALGGIGMSVVAIVSLEISEHRTLFGFQDYGYRPAIVIALASEAAAAVLLALYLAVRRSS